MVIASGGCAERVQSHASCIRRAAASEQTFFSRGRAKLWNCVMPRLNPSPSCLILRAWTLPQVLHPVQQVSKCFVTSGSCLARIARHDPTETFEQLR